MNEVFALGLEKEDITNELNTYCNDLVISEKQDRRVKKSFEKSVKGAKKHADKAGFGEREDIDKSFPSMIKYMAYSLRPIVFAV